MRAAEYWVVQTFEAICDSADSNVKGIGKVE